MRAQPALALAILGAALAGCTAAPAPATPDPDGGIVDPLLASTVAGPLLSDPTLGYQANRDAVRPPDMPLSAPIPPIDIVPAGQVVAAEPGPAPDGTCTACGVARGAVTLGALAARLGNPVAAACAPTLRYSAMWATRLDADLPLPPAARVIEAGGSDGPGCRLRAVTYGAAVPLATLLAAEHARATRAGYAVRYQAEGDLHALVGRRPRGDFITLVARDASNGVTEIRVVMAGRP